MKDAAWIGALVGLCLGACATGGSKDKTTPPPPPADAAPVDSPPAAGTGGHMVDARYYVDSTGPDPLACATDKDCIGDTVTDDKGCCIASSRAWPQSWAYHTWLSTKRRATAECKAMQCPPLGTPMPPRACEMDGKCVSGKCQNSCEGGR
jgi:hypothetical protein